jgi:hypothetical protein
MTGEPKASHPSPKASKNPFYHANMKRSPSSLCYEKLARKTLWTVLKKKTHCIIFAKIIKPPHVGNKKILIVINVLRMAIVIKLKTVEC